MQPYHVRAVHCDHRSSDEEVYQALKRATDPLIASWQRLRAARRIGIKFNQHWRPDRVVMHEGHRQQLVSDPVVRATLRLLRENTSADLFVIDVGAERPVEGQPDDSLVTIMPILREMGITYVDGTHDPVAWVDVPGGGSMFRRYPVPRSTVEADAMVSVQKLKNHAFMGVTLCTKNLFGLMPFGPDGRARHYYHHLVRMPYMLADLGRIFDPVLNIVDGMICQAGMEWGDGRYPRVCDTLLAGDQCIATDACAASLMGHDPASDWLTPPFHRDRNHLRVAAEGGFGTVELRQIDFRSEVQGPLGEFFSVITDSQEQVTSWRRTTAEQALHYLDHRREIADRHRGQYILLQMGQVRWAGPTGDLRASRRQLSGDHPEQGMWLKYVDPDEAEGEQYQVYDRALREAMTAGV